MSSGTRIPYSEAYRIVRYVMEVLTKVAADDQERAAVDQMEDVGSLRRRKPTIGDLEALAPFPSVDASDKVEWENDPLFRVLNRIVDNPMTKPKKPAAVLWLANKEEPPEPESRVLGTAIKGLKPGFKAASILLRARVGEIKLEIFRAERDAYGWAQVRLTGPEAFSVYFLTQWKRRRGIEFGEEHKGSIDGFLVDAGKRVVSVPTEKICFQENGMQFIEPEDREAWIENVQIEREVYR